MKRDHVQALPELDAQLRQLERAVTLLDLGSRDLEAKLASAGGGGGGGSAGAGGSTYTLLSSVTTTLQQSLVLPRMGSSDRS